MITTLLADSAESHKAGPLGIVVVVALGIACYFLFRSMAGHLRKVRDTFPDTTASPPATVPPSASVAPPSATPAPPSTSALRARSAQPKSRQATSRQTTSRPAESRPAESRPAESRPAESRPAEDKAG